MNDKKASWLIIIVSVIVPLLVAFLIFSPLKGGLNANDIGFLPQLNAIINSSTALLLIVGKIMIKQGKERAHKTIMYSAFILSILFLVSYVIYHANAPHTKYGGEDSMKYVYYFLLLTHILLSAIVVPMVLFSIYFAIKGKLDRHKKWVKWTWPIWVYVSFSGVFVYLLISPYYLK